MLAEGKRKKNGINADPSYPRPERRPVGMEREDFPRENRYTHTRSIRLTDGTRINLIVHYTGSTPKGVTLSLEPGEQARMYVRDCDAVMMPYPDAGTYKVDPVDGFEVLCDMMLWEVNLLIHLLRNLEEELYASQGG